MGLTHTKPQPCMRRLKMPRGIYVRTEETKRKLSGAHKGQVAWNKGIEQTKETKLKISFANKGKASFYGKHHSEETKRKISEKLIGRIIPEEIRQHMGIRTGKNNNMFGQNHSGEKGGAWKGGVCINAIGYRKVYNSEATKGRYKEPYIPEHRLVMEQSLERKLTPKEVVHHINKDKLDNRIENLMLFENDIAHQNYHAQLKKQKTA